MIRLWILILSKRRSLTTLMTPEGHQYFLNYTIITTHLGNTQKICKHFIQDTLNLMFSLQILNLSSPVPCVKTKIQQALTITSGNGQMDFSLSLDKLKPFCRIGPVSYVTHDQIYRNAQLDQLDWNMLLETFLH